MRLSFCLLPSIKQPSVTMKRKAKKASSDSENIQFCYLVFDISDLLHRQSRNSYLWRVVVGWCLMYWLNVSNQSNDLIGCFCLFFKQHLLSEWAFLLTNGLVYGIWCTCHVDSRFYHLMTTGSRLHWLLSYETHSWRWRIKRRRLKQWNEVRTHQLFVMHNNCVIFILFFLRELEKVMAFLKYTYYEGKAFTT